MRGPALQLVKGGLDRVDGVGAGLAALLPAPGGRELDTGDAAQFAQGSVRKLRQALHDSSVEEPSIIRMTEQRANLLHLFFLLLRGRNF